MLLNPAEISQLAGLIRAVTQGYVVNHMGRDFASITDDEYKQLKASGLVDPSEVDSFRQAFKTGFLTAWQQPQQKYIGFTSIGALDKQWKDALKGGMPDLSPIEEGALMRSKAKAAVHLQGLGNQYAHDFSVIAIETDHETRKQLQQVTADKISEAIINRATSRKLASSIGDAFNDWSRDLRRIAEYELEDAHQHGVAALIHQTSGPGTQVAKLVDPDACPTCRKLYLDSDGRPKIFSLAELEGNGTNFGLKRSEWLPVVGPAHPFCHCSLVEVPDGFGFSESGQLVSLDQLGS